ncbi:hypothetical protein QU481_02645 [Crenobacter sp. SG2303]|uniref:Yip1 domain-containing protein n=1 Tax=Crenobacter oryzisoli TaxID=3056844 RepID=A0ABT7XJA3_9NEIS|nr:hypothetical protein [Crenobacter sp. SG2303]MDN0073793.1 hypothetical protein [Crenobacter sp. SG2303]
MRALIDDAINLVRLKVAPLEHYQYPFWKLAIALTLLGVIAGAGVPELGSGGGRVLFFVLFTWLETVLFARFIGWWLRQAGWRTPLPLLGLVVACNGLQLLMPLLSWLPDDVAQAISLALSLASLYVLVNALSRVTKVARVRVALGVLAFAPVALGLMMLTLTLSASLGWVNVPSDLLSDTTSSQGASSGADDSAL